MAEYGRGIKAGVVAGIIYGIILTVLVAALAEAIMPGFWGVVSTAGAGLTGAVIGIFAVMLIIGGAIGGLIFGAVYAAAYGSLPGSSVVKGIIIAIIFWLVFSVGLNYSYVSRYPAYAGIGLVSSLVWGALVGVFWDKFGK